MTQLKNDVDTSLKHQAVGWYTRHVTVCIRRRHTNGTNQAEKEVTALDSSDPAADTAEGLNIASAAQGLQVSH